MNKSTFIVNLMATEYMRVQKEIEMLEKRKAEIAAELKSNGSIETESFKISVSKIEQERLVGLDKVAAVVGMDKLKKNGLVSKSSYERLSVSAKAQIDMIAKKSA